MDTVEYNSQDKYIGVPASFFGILLESINDILILKCAFRSIFILNTKKKSEAFITPLELEYDLVVRGALSESTEGSNSLFAVLALDKCVEIGLLKQFKMPVDDGSNEVDSKRMIYFLTNDFSRMTQKKLDHILNIAKSKQIELERFTDSLGQELPSRFPKQKINSLFEIYEANIGLIYPLAAEKLQEIESEYPHGWIVEAFSLAVNYNRRNLAYIEAILRRWSDEGRGNQIDRGDSGSITIGEIAKRQQQRKRF